MLSSLNWQTRSQREDEVRGKNTAGFSFGFSLNGKTARLGLFVVAIDSEKTPSKFVRAE